MRLRLTALGVELSTELKDYVKRRVHFTLGRFAGRIKSLTVSLADINGPRGGVDKCCEIRVNAGFRRRVMVRENHASVHAAVAFATERAERAVQRQLSLAGPAERRIETARTGIESGD